MYLESSVFTYGHNHGLIVWKKFCRCHKASVSFQQGVQFTCL